MIRVTLPHHLRQLANVNGEIALQVDGQITQRSILDALEARYPMLRGTICRSNPRMRRCPTQLPAAWKNS